MTTLWRLPFLPRDFIHKNDIASVYRPVECAKCFHIFHSAWVSVGKKRIRIPLQQAPVMYEVLL